MELSQVLEDVRNTRQDNTFTLPHQRVDTRPPEVPYQTAFGGAITFNLRDEPEAVEDEVCGSQMECGLGLVPEGPRRTPLNHTFKECCAYLRGFLG